MQSRTFPKMQSNFEVAVIIRKLESRFLSCSQFLESYSNAFWKVAVSFSKLQAYSNVVVSFLQVAEKIAEDEVTFGAFLKLSAPQNLYLYRYKYNIL